MLARYVWADLVRNPRRTASSAAGVALGVGLFCGVLFFVDGLSASMTQRAVAPLPIDMQRIVTEQVGGALTLTQSLEDSPASSDGVRRTVTLRVLNASDVSANEVIVRSVPGAEVAFVVGSGTIDGVPVEGFDDNPFAHGPGAAGLNIGTVEPRGERTLSYVVEAPGSTAIGEDAVASWSSSRESLTPVPANEPATVQLADLAALVARVDGVASATELSIAELGIDSLSSPKGTVTGPARIFGFGSDHADRDSTIAVVDGGFDPGGVLISAEAASELGVGLGDTVTVNLPDDSTVEWRVSGVADLSRARSLFSSRRGGDLETFVYARNSVVVPPQTFADVVLPAFEKAATTRGDRLKAPPIREIDIGLDRHLLDADPATAVQETERIAGDISAVAAHQDYLLDNISNTLTVAAADASAAKRLFVFLGVPGGLLAALLSAYAGSVLADAQRREQATLRIRGASRRHLLRMLALRTAALTAAGSLVGLTLGYVVAASILGADSLSRASTASLVTSALVGTLGGLAATGAALYVTGRRSIDREINEDRARFAATTPLWRRFGLDIGCLVVVGIGTGVALRSRSFDGSAGSIYFGRAVELNLMLLVLPIAVWIAGSLLAARLVGTVLTRTQPSSRGELDRPLTSLYRLSVGRRPWPIGNGVVIVSLIVALTTSLGAFTASYDSAKRQDARFATGSDIRITPSPTSHVSYGPGDADVFRTDGVSESTPVIFGLSNVILRSQRTSDPANLVALDPDGFTAVAPLSDSDFASGDAAGAMRALKADPTAVLVSREMLDFLAASVGDTVGALLVRATDAQSEVELHVVDVYEKFPGFPEGADAVMSLDGHAAAVPSKNPDFFLAATSGPDDAALERAVTSIRQGPGTTDTLQIDTRLTNLDRDQSSLAALNIAGLVDLDSGFALAMAAVTIGIFVFGLLLQRRREYITLKAQGLESRTVRLLIGAESATLAIAGSVAGVAVGAAMGFYFVVVLRPLFVLAPTYSIPLGAMARPVALVAVATLVSTAIASLVIDRLEPTELLRDE